MHIRLLKYFYKSKEYYVSRLASILVVVAAICFATSNLQAGVYEASFNGEDFLEIGYFPIAERQPILSDTSIWFDHADYSDSRARWEKLAELPVLPAGTFSNSDTVVISILINLTWLENDASDNDWDPHIMLNDGVNSAGITILEQGNVDLASCVDADVLYDDTWPGPQRVSYGGLLATPPLANVGMSFDIEVTWTLSPAGTSIEVTHLGSTASANSIVNLNPAGKLGLGFLSDNQLHEKYQINFVDVVAETEGITCNCDDPGLFEPPMDDSIIVKKGTRVIPLKFSLCDDDGYPLTDQDISAPMVEVDYSGLAGNLDFEEEDFLVTGKADIGNIFVYSGSKWQLNLQTKMFDASGVYTLTVVSTDPDSYEIFPTCSVDFIIE